MTTRIPRLWQPGCSRPRVFLPDFCIKLVEQPKRGYKRIPRNAAVFEVDLRMSRLDIREYLEKIYKFPVRDVRTYVKIGDITWDYPKDVEKRKALWKEEDRKIAFVFFRKDFIAEIPDLFSGQGSDEEINKMEKYQEQDLNAFNRRFVNRERAGIGEMLPV
uniref:Large ribosomal subunit protein uL23m n=1 Tax=Globodera rostochiensis TaxID=31243 RepID=A0A914GUD6_GLORO